MQCNSPNCLVSLVVHLFLHDDQSILTWVGTMDFPHRPVFLFPLEAPVLNEMANCQLCAPRPGTSVGRIYSVVWMRSMPDFSRGQLWDISLLSRDPRSSHVHCSISWTISRWFHPEGNYIASGGCEEKRGSLTHAVLEQIGSQSNPPSQLGLCTYIFRAQKLPDILFWGRNYTFYATSFLCVLCIPRPYNSITLHVQKCVKICDALLTSHDHHSLHQFCSFCKSVLFCISLLWFRGDLWR